MRTTQTVAVLALAVLVAGAGLTAAVTDPLAQSQGDAPGGETVSVGASGAAETAPDQAVLHVAVVKRADSASQVRQQLADNVSKMREALRQEGVADEQVQTVRYDIRRNHRPRPAEGGEAEEPQYRGSHEFEITLTDLDEVGTVIDTAVENGATEVDNVRFTLSSEKERELRNQALEDAMSNARSQAETLAAAGDLEVTGVHAVSTTESHHPRFEAAAVATDAGGGGTAVESGPVTVAVQVQVTYNATEA